ncbi:MAG: glycosyltransferase [Elusimicrobia bacterium]|nr:glycosyltransferase [Elusimicrobiota bacterium]
MTDALVSVIVATYNRPTLLLETVRTLLDQTHRRTEIIVIDNHSLADVGGMLQRLGDERLRFFKNPNRGIIAVNRNEGLRHARGQFVAFCDDDDLWVPEKLETQLRFFDPARHFGVGSSAVLIGDVAIHRRRPALPQEDRDLAGLLTHGAPPLSSLLVARTDAFFSEDPRYRNVEDFEFQVRMAARTGKSIGLLAKPLIRYRVHAANTNRERAHRLNATHVVWSLKPRIAPPLFRTALSRQYFLAGMAALRAGDPVARRFFRRTIALGGPMAGKARWGRVLTFAPARLWPIAFRGYYGAVNAGTRAD